MGGLTAQRARAKPRGMLVYKILRSSEWAAFDDAGETSGAPVDLADGFIHLSSAAQVAETAAKHFAGAEGLWLLAVGTEGLGEALRWEPSRGGQLFPHLYGELRRKDVVWARPLPLGSDGHVFPEEMS